MKWREESPTVIDGGGQVERAVAPNRARERVFPSSLHLRKPPSSIQGTFCDSGVLEMTLKDSLQSPKADPTVKWTPSK